MPLYHRNYTRSGFPPVSTQELDECFTQFRTLTVPERMRYHLLHNGRPLNQSIPQKVVKLDPSLRIGTAPASSRGPRGLEDSFHAASSPLARHYRAETRRGMRSASLPRLHTARGLRAAVESPPSSEEDEEDEAEEKVDARQLQRSILFRMVQERSKHLKDKEEEDMQSPPLHLSASPNILGETQEFFSSCSINYYDDGMSGSPSVELASRSKLNSAAGRESGSPTLLPLGCANPITSPRDLPLPLLSSRKKRG